MRGSASDANASLVAWQWADTKAWGDTPSTLWWDSSTSQYWTREGYAWKGEKFVVERKGPFREGTSTDPKTHCNCWLGHNESCPVHPRNEWVFEEREPRTKVTQSRNSLIGEVPFDTSSLEIGQTYHFRWVRKIACSVFECRSKTFGDGRTGATPTPSGSNNSPGRLPASHPVASQPAPTSLCATGSASQQRSSLKRPQRSRPAGWRHRTQRRARPTTTIPAPKRLRGTCEFYASYLRGCDDFVTSYVVCAGRQRSSPQSPNRLAPLLLLRGQLCRIRAVDGRIITTHRPGRRPGNRAESRNLCTECAEKKLCL